MARIQSIQNIHSCNTKGSRKKVAASRLADGAKKRERDTDIRRDACDMFCIYLTKEKKTEKKRASKKFNLGSKINLGVLEARLCCDIFLHVIFFR